MNGQDFVTLKRQEPFRPFRVRMNDGRTVDAPKRDLFLVCGSCVIIGILRAGSNSTFPETFTRLDYPEIAQVEMLDGDKALHTK